MDKSGNGQFGRRLAVAALASALIATMVAGGPGAAADKIATAAAKISGKKIKKKSLPYNRLNRAAQKKVEVIGTRSYIRSSYSHGDNLNITGTNSNQSIRTVVITVPKAGQLLINGGMKPDATVDDVYSCAIWVNGALLGASDRTTKAFAAAPDESCETSDATDVAAGTYTVELIGNGLSNDIDDTSLQVLFVPGS